MNIVIIEDNKETARAIIAGLAKIGWQVDTFGTTHEGVASIAKKAYDVVVLDRMLPNSDGLETLKLLRSVGITVPVIMLTAKAEIQDRVEGIEAGADDYMVKPFAMEELIARIKLVLRRTKQQESQATFTVGNLSLDRMTQSAKREDKNLVLSPVEYRLLEYLVICKNTVVSKRILLEKVWGYQFDPQTSIVETHISRLRAKIDKPFDRQLIRTVKGTGYIMTEI